MSTIGLSNLTVVDRALDVHNLFAAYQPIVDLVDGSVVAFEALARWRDPDLVPDVVFPAAQRAGRLAQLDWSCRIAAVRGALEARLAPGQTLFINVEPATLGANVPADAIPVLARAGAELRIMIELTERSLLRNPSGVLRVVAWAREQGWGIALDDVGAEPDSLTILPFVAPDVIKLDISLIQEQPDREQGRIMAAVLAHAEATGGTILAEGIETPVHLEQALALGATLGQGWYFGRPGPLPKSGARVQPIALSTPVLHATTPFSLVAHSDRRRVARKSVLLGMSHHLESLGTKDNDLVVLAGFQSADRFTPATKRRYTMLGAQCSLVGALGLGMAEVPAPGVRGASLAADDELIGEWTVVVVGPHYAGALIAKDCGDDGPDRDRRFEFVVTHDRALVVDAARSLLARLVPVD